MRAKKAFAQHFLKDTAVVNRIISTLPTEGPLLEIGPGKGALTSHIDRMNLDYRVVEIDPDMIDILIRQHQIDPDRIIQQDFLQLDLGSIFSRPYHVIGNFPYNISTQILFKIIENNEHVYRMVGMFQREVGQRVCAEPGSKTYGITSVLTQLYYKTNYLFTVPETAFAPQPKVKSGVIELIRKSTSPDISYWQLKRVVKQGFQQRRKMLRNSLKSIVQSEELLQAPIFSRRPEQLSLTDFIDITKRINPRL